MLAGLWHAPESGKSEGEQRLGTSTIGSSEACMLGGLALKRRWSVARKKAGKSTDKPNLILGINAQVSFVHMHVLTLKSLVCSQVCDALWHVGSLAIQSCMDSVSVHMLCIVTRLHLNARCLQHCFPWNPKSAQQWARAE